MLTPFFPFALHWLFFTTDIFPSAEESHFNLRGDYCVCAGSYCSLVECCAGKSLFSEMFKIGSVPYSAKSL